MYQTYDDMVEDEYLRKRIRNILGDQVKARGYGNSWNAELGARNYPNENEGGVAVGGMRCGGDAFENEHIDLYSLPSVSKESKRKRKKAHNTVHGGYGKKSNWTECVSRHKGTKNASKFYDKKTKVCRSSQSQTAKKRGLSAWQQFVRDNSRDENGNSRSMKTLSQMYKSGGVVIPAKSSMIDSGDERYINEGGEYMGGIYLR